MNKPVTEKNYVCIGKIVGAHGAKGASKIVSYAESLSVFKAGDSILIGSKAQKKAYRINWVKPHGRAALLSLKGVAGREAAAALLGSELFIDKARLPELESDTYYWFDLIGLSVFTRDREYLGRLESIIATGSNDVYVVRHVQHEVLIPALESVVVAVDLERKRMLVDLPAGLDG